MICYGCGKELQPHEIKSNLLTIACGACCAAIYTMVWAWVGNQAPYIENNTMFIPIESLIEAVKRNGYIWSGGQLKRSD